MKRSLNNKKLGGSDKRTHLLLAITSDPVVRQNLTTEFDSGPFDSLEVGEDLLKIFAEMRPPGLKQESLAWKHLKTQ